jgi:glycerol-3-phosphate dehydrogenase
MARVTVFGAGANGTAIAMHLARNGNQTLLWASEFDQGILPGLVEQRRHPALPEHLPDSLRVVGPEGLVEAADGIDIAVMGAHSGGARTLARIVVDGCGPLPLVVGVAKGLEAESLKPRWCRLVVHAWPARWLRAFRALWCSLPSQPTPLRRLLTRSDPPRTTCA